MKRWDHDIDPTFDKGKGPGFEISRVWIIACDDGRGAEGLPAFGDPDTGVIVSLVATDERRVPMIVELARQIAADPAAKGRRFYLVRFSGREVLEEIKAMTMDPPPPHEMGKLFADFELRVLLAQARKLGDVYRDAYGGSVGSAVENGFLIGAAWLRERDRAGCTVTEMDAPEKP